MSCGPSTTSTTTTITSSTTTTTMPCGSYPACGGTCPTGQICSGNYTNDSCHCIGASCGSFSCLPGQECGCGSDPSNPFNVLCECVSGLQRACSPRPWPSAFLAFLDCLEQPASMEHVAVIPACLVAAMRIAARMRARMDRAAVRTQAAPAHRAPNA